MIGVLFHTFAAVALGGALGVVLSRNPIASLLFMVASLGSIAGIFVLFDAHFLAAIQILVYAGAIMVLFLFVIMLLNLGHESKKDLRGGAWIIAAFAVTGTLAGLLARQVGGETEGGWPSSFLGGGQADPLLSEAGAVEVIAHPLFSTYVVPFEIAGVLLLVAIVGALALAKKHV